MRRRTWLLLLVAVGTASITLNVGLLRFAYKHAATPPRESGAPLSVGSTVPVFTAKDLDGRSFTFRPGPLPTVLYVISPSCRWCALNTENIRSLLRQAGDRYRFIGVSLASEGLREHLRRYSLPFPVYTLDRPTIEVLGLGVTPSTIVVDATGRIVRKWNGAYRRSQGSVEAYFGVRLPGLLAEETEGKVAPDSHAPSGLR